MLENAGTFDSQKLQQPQARKRVILFHSLSLFKYMYKVSAIALGNFSIMSDLMVSV